MIDNFSCERPWAFYGLVFVVPAVILSLVRYFRLSRNSFLGTGNTLVHMRKSLVSRMVCWSFAWTMLVTAFSGISWGTELKPVHQSGASVSFVFDISHSMTAKDVFVKGEAPISRLQACSSYADALLDKLDGVDVSAVIAKGDGIVAVPQTNDKNAIRSLLPSLSPWLMTSIGSSIGNGISQAASSFPLHSVASRTIVVFTDGEETDGIMSKMAEDVVKSGIQLVFLGFGDEKESQILSGDGQTYVQTALRANELENVVESVNATFSNISQRQRLSGLGTVASKAFFIPAQKFGSAHELVDIIKNSSTTSSLSGTVYEVQGIPRWKLFCTLALICLFLGFVLAEFNLASFFVKSNSTNAMIVVFVVFSSVVFQGCSSDWEGSSKILEGTFHWYQKDFREAVTSFMQTTEYAQANDNQTLYQYGLYGLATTYLVQGEMPAAFERFEQMSEQAPDGLKFATLYNIGIISYRNGKYEDAARFFRKALLEDGSNVDAKINLELSLRQISVKSAEVAQEMMPTQENKEDSRMENTIFSLIREKEQDKWKNQQTQEKSDSTLDY